LDDYGNPTIDVSPKKLFFSLTPELEEAMKFAEVRLGDQIHSYSNCVLNFDKYGKKLLTQEYHLSPDAYVQLALQLSYFKMYGCVSNSYEVVATKEFFHGRTEGLRSATVEVSHTCDLFFNPDIPVTQKKLAMEQAIRTHSKHVKDCTRGKGVDRHLYALKCMVDRHNLELPEFYRSKAYKLLERNTLSTSNCGNPALRLYGIGPADSDGYGIGYIIKDQSISFSLSSKHRQTERFRYALESVLLEMETVLRNFATLASSPDTNGSLDPRARLGLSRFRNRRGRDIISSPVSGKSGARSNRNEYTVDGHYGDIYGDEGLAAAHPPPPPPPHISNPDAMSSPKLPPRKTSEAAPRN
jgi:hypothetical protein